jgi:phosphoribosyl 1,2-cyclic phosphodiesterase
MRVWLFSSGSSGNAAIVEAAGGRLLVDAGLGPKTIAARMRSLGGELFPRGVDAVVVTHQHGDHIAHLEPLARALRVPLFLHRGIRASRVQQRYEVRPYATGGGFTVGPFHVESYPIPHDAPQVALRVSAGGASFGLATDLGHVPRGLAEFLGACDEVLLEANYCPDMMREGPYPPNLQRRVTGDFGHLANEQTAVLAAALVSTRVRKLWLGHLSKINNTPERALAGVRAMVRDLPVEVIPHGESKVLDVRPAPARGWRKPVQMALPFG